MEKRNFRRDCSSFSLDIFKEDFKSNIKNEFITEFSDFLNVFWKFLINIHLSRKYI